jgi:ATPase subunit of ABC transporter with duplicated ATPase domains
VCCLLGFLGINRIKSQPLPARSGNLTKYVLQRCENKARQTSKKNMFKKKQKKMETMRQKLRKNNKIEPTN